MIRVAIVEDEMLVRLGLRMCLESSPDIYVAGAFASAEEAETGQDKAPVDVLLTDIRLPGKSGLELMRRLRMDGEFPHEIGLFLSYPPEDVRGFIENRAANYKLVGTWKVYGDVDKARETFKRYRDCTENYRTRQKAGSSIEQLAV